MANQFDVQSKLFEIISNLSQYDSPDKLEELKKELKFLQEWDPDNSICIVDYGINISEAINIASGSVVTYLFCFPGCICDSVAGVNSNLRFVPLSTAFSGVTFNPSEFLSQGYFTGAYLRNTNFLNAIFTDADLTGADLSNSSLEGANLTNAKIHLANFCGANLSEAAMPEYANTIAEFKAVVGSGNWDENTIWVTSSHLS